MIPAIHPACNFTLKPAPGDEERVGSLPVMIHPAGVACFYLPTTQELYAINRGEAICISLAMDIREQRFPPIMVGIHGDMFKLPEPEPRAEPIEGVRPCVDLALMLHGNRSEVAKFLRKAANAVDEGTSIAGVSSPALEVRLMSTDPYCAEVPGE